MANVYPIKEKLGKQAAVTSGDAKLYLAAGSVLDAVVTGEVRKAVYISSSGTPSVENAEAVAFDDDTAIFVASASEEFYGYLKDSAEDYPAETGYDPDLNAWQITDGYPGEYGADNLVAVLKKKLDTLLGAKKTFDGFVLLFEPDKVSIGEVFARG